MKTFTDALIRRYNECCRNCIDGKCNGIGWCEDVYDEEKARRREAIGNGATSADLRSGVPGNSGIGQVPD